MTDRGFALFETALGWCAIVWRGRAVSGVSLPETDAAAMRQRMRRRFPDAEEAEPPPEVAQAQAGVAALLAGDPRDLQEIELDDERLGPFERAVYAATRAIPPGETRSYGQIAAAAGEPGAAQAVGRALGRNPFPVVVPCHRVLAADGRLHGFSGPGGLETKLKLLAIEGGLGAGEPRLFGSETLSLRPR